jgi:hypothetical protein
LQIVIDDSKRRSAAKLWQNAWLFYEAAIVLDNDAKQEQQSIPAVLDGSMLTPEKFYQYELNIINVLIMEIILILYEYTYYKRSRV